MVLALPPDSFRILSGFENELYSIGTGQLYSMDRFNADNMTAKVGWLLLSLVKKNVSANQIARLRHRHIPVTADIDVALLVARVTVCVLLAD
jgi:hypothetical protein